MSIRRRLGKLEAEAGAVHPTETADEREKRLTMTREGAEQQNEKYPREPPFVIADDGTVTSSRDGRPVTSYPATSYPATSYPATSYPATSYPATIAEVWFWEEMERGEAEGLRLVYDEEAEAFYNGAGEFALCRDFADLRGLLGPNSG